MANVINFPSTTPNNDLPLLFSGQNQKEFIVNQAIATIDALLPASIEASLDEPPATPVEGQCFRVNSTAIGEWAPHLNAIAVRIADAWHFIDPQEGYEVYDKALKQKLIFKNGWQQIVTPAAPQGGVNIDVELRAMVVDLVDALRSAGIFADPAS